MMNARMRGSRAPLVRAALATLATFTATFAAAATLGAQGGAAVDVRHALVLRPVVPPGAGPINYDVRWRSRENTAASPGGVPGNRQRAGVVNGGGGVVTGLNETVAGAFDAPVPATVAGRAAAAAPAWLVSQGPLSDAHAIAQGDVNPFPANPVPAPPPPITGNIRSAVIVAGQLGGTASASARMEVSARGGRGLANGRIRWGPRVQQSVSARAYGAWFDPLDFSIFAPDDLFGPAPFSGELLDITGTMTGAGWLDWDAEGTGQLAVDASDMTLSIVLASPYTVQQGTLDFRMAGGTVVTSSATGIFAGLMPSVGATGPFMVNFGAFDLDYDLSSLLPADLDGVSPEIELAMSNAATAQVVPEPPTLLLVFAGATLLAAVAARRRCAGG